MNKQYQYQTCIAVIAFVAISSFLLVGEHENSGAESDTVLVGLGVHRRSLRSRLIDPKTVKPRLKIPNNPPPPLIHQFRTPSNNYKECIHHMSSNRLPTLISQLNQNPEANGITPQIHQHLISDSTTNTT